MWIIQCKSIALPKPRWENGKQVILNPSTGKDIDYVKIRYGKKTFFNQKTCRYEQYNPLVKPIIFGTVAVTFLVTGAITVINRLKEKDLSISQTSAILNHTQAQKYNYKAEANKYFNEMEKHHAIYAARYGRYGEFIRESNLEKIVHKDKNIFIISGAHGTPEHILNMAKIFEQEQIADNLNTWLFLAEGHIPDCFEIANIISRRGFSVLAQSPEPPALEAFYVAQSAHFWNIPIFDVIPRLGLEEPEFLLTSMRELGVEETVMFHVNMYGSSNVSQSILLEYIKFCEDNGIPFDQEKARKIQNEIAEDKEASLFAAYMMNASNIRNRLGKERVQKLLEQHSERNNILVYCGTYHREIFIP